MKRTPEELKASVKAMLQLEREYIEFISKKDSLQLDLGKWLPSLGRVVRPLVPGELMTVLANTGVGKTAILQNIAKAAYPQTVLMFEMELPGSLMFERAAALATDMHGTEIEALYKDGASLDRRMILMQNLFVCTAPRLSTEDMAICIADLKPSIVMVDYIGLMGTSLSRSRYERTSDAAQSLKVFAKESNTIVIAACQVHRSERAAKPDDKEDNEVRLHDAKDSGEIENSSGLVLDAWRETKQQKGDTMHVRVLKNTKGISGALITCNFEGSKTRITERARATEGDESWHQEQH